MYTGVDRGASKFISHTVENNQNVFTVEQGTRFYLKLKLRANPSPNSCDIYQNGVLLPPAAPGEPVINFDIDSVSIRNIEAADAANYTLTCSNSMGKGQFSFRLKVVGKVLFLSNYFCTFCWIKTLYFPSPLQLQMHTTSYVPLTSGIKTMAHRAKLKLLIHAHVATKITFAAIILYTRLS